MTARMVLDFRYGYMSNVTGTRDRDLKLNGYEVFRFGTAELHPRGLARTLLQTFFSDLFRHCPIPASAP